MRHKIAIIINTSSGTQSTNQTITELREACVRHSVNADFLSVHKGSEISFRVKKAVDEGYTLIVAAGGDGTINTVAGALVHTSVILGILPLGTFNHLAQDLGIPLTIDEALQVLLKGNSTAIDVGTVNDYVFANNASIGLYPSLVFLREQRQKLGWSKWRAAVWAMVELFNRYSSAVVRLKFEDREVLRKTPFVFIGNNNYHVEGLTIGSRSSLTEGQLSIYLAHRPGRWELVRVALAALFKKSQEHSSIDSYQTTDLTIETKKKTIRVALDGEIKVLSTPLRFAIQPRALLVQTPNTNVEKI